MQFNQHEAQRLLAQTPSVLHAWLANLPEAWIRANEGPETWSAFDIVGHLIHGERTDWIPRARIILGPDSPKKFTPFDRFAQHEVSKGKSIGDLLNEFEGLRADNLKILESFRISDSDWLKTGTHPEFGDVTLRQLISTWAVHDQSHIAQIARVLAKQYADEAGPWRAYIPILGQ